MSEQHFSQERRDAFGRNASAYRDGRPGYPDEVYEVLQRVCGLGPTSQVLEIGAGAGQATSALLDAGAEVTAVELGAELAEVLVDRLGQDRLNVVVGSFEEVELSPESFDLVAAATAFHWIDPEVGPHKAATLLRPGGWLALWWTSYGDLTKHDPFHDALTPILRRLAPELVDDGNAGVDVQPYVFDKQARVAEIDATGAFGPVQQHLVHWTGRHTPAEARALFASFSPWMALPEPRRTELLDEVETLAADDFNGLVERPYVTATYLAQRVALDPAS